MKEDIDKDFQSRADKLFQTHEYNERNGIGSAQIERKALKAVRKDKAYKENLKSKKGVRRTMANWQDKNFEEFMKTWNDIEDPATKARLYLDTFQYTIGKIRSVDHTVTHQVNTLEDRLTNLIEGNTNEIEDIEAEEVDDDETED